MSGAMMAPSSKPSEIMFDSIDSLRAAGFDGFVTVSDLARSGCLEVPTTQGVYLVVRDPALPPKFMPSSPAGWFKGRNPTVKVEVLAENWVPDTVVLYVGEAGGSGKRGRLQQRIKRRIRFGSGKIVSAWGGRYVWQLADHRSLRFAWKPADDALGEERLLIKKFKDQYGRLPFANIKDESTSLDADDA